MSKTRILLVSDVHYTTEETRRELREKYPGANGSTANGPILGYSQKERMDYLLECINKEHEAAPLHAILMPGDLSIDDYDFRHLPYNFCEKFRDDYMSKMPVPICAGPGNHDSYSDEQWFAMFGHHRQFSIVANNALFLMADTYNAPADGASGSPYTHFDIEWAKREMEIHKDKPVFILAHYLWPKREGEAFAEFLRENPRIAAIFVGHSHRYEVIRLGEEYGNKNIYDIGGFSYYTRPTDGVWDFNMFNPEWRWGYQMLEFDENSFKTWHVFPERTYHAHNGEFVQPLEITPAEEIEFAK